MAYTHYDRLSALDAAFLEIEDANAHMHVGAVAVFDGDPLRREDGGLDIDRVYAGIESSLHRTPRYRQRIAHVPVSGDPVWVDDARFNLHYHLRHTCLPAPGDERMLKRLAGRIMSQQLDRGKPLWELWVIDGLAEGRFATITKAHHCMIDGVGSVGMTGAALSESPDSSRPPEPHRWVPRPVPSAFDLALGELGRRIRGGLDAVEALRQATGHPLDTLERLGDAAGAIGEAIRAGLRPATATPLNVEIGPHRRFDWLRFEIAEIKEIGSILGGTLNDVSLAIASGALRRFLRQRGEDVESLDFRAMIPVNVRSEGTAGRAGNFISMMTAGLPLAERSPRRRLERVVEITRALKASRQSRGVETIEGLSDATFSGLFSLFARLASNSLAYNLTVTNVPGPRSRRFLLGAPMRAVYPLVPLSRNQALGIALFSYDGGLFWGFNSDWDAMPDLHDLVEAVTAEFEALRKACSEG